MTDRAPRWGPGDASSPGVPTAGGVYLGCTDVLRFAGPQQSVLVLGPPRSGKTSSVVVPSVLLAPGAVVSTSTKADVLRITATVRSRRGPCYLFDPGSTTEPPPGVQRLRWSPISSCGQWDGARLMASDLVTTARPDVVGREEHWTERAHALLGPLLHAAAVDGAAMADVLSWVDRHDLTAPLRILEDHDALLAADVLAGIAATEAREQSGIWSTASSVVSAYRSEAVLESTRDPNLDPAAFCDSSGTIYICSPARQQRAFAPLVVGLLGDIRSAAYDRQRAAETARWRGSSEAPEPPPVLLALDEVANIAPLPDLPSMVSEGGSQGLVTLACLQDLSQARARWGRSADGFLSLFSVTEVLPGIGDVPTLQAISTLAGDELVATRSLSQSLTPPQRPGRVVLRALLGRRTRLPPPAPSQTVSTSLQPRLSVDKIAQGRPRSALVVGEANQMGWITLTPWFEWTRSVEGGPGPERGPTRSTGRPHEPERGPDRD